MKDGLGLRWSFMGPFETIELNAPDGIADYFFFFRLSAADSSIYDGEKLNRILAQWGKPPGPEQIAARMRWRDRRLATLKVHIRSQPAS